MWGHPVLYYPIFLGGVDSCLAMMTNSGAYATDYTMSLSQYLVDLDC